MPKLWGLHHCVMAYNQLRDWKGRPFPFQAIPFDARMRVGDFVYLFWGDESLYGWGMIEKLTPDNDGLHQTAAVRFIDSEPPGPSVTNQIKNNALFANWDNLKEEGCLSRFNNDQLRYLNSLLPHGHPPDPDEVRESAAVPPTLRHVVERFVQGQRIPFDETRFDEFKTITSRNVVRRIMDELEPYVLGYLCLEDRRDETICRIFWGVDNARRIVGITLADEQRDEVRRLITEKLRRTKPPLPTGARFVEPHQVYDANGNAVPDLFVLEVGVAPGEEGVIYVSENDSVYIRSENTTAKLTTTELIAEIRRRERNQLLRPKR